MLFSLCLERDCLRGQTGAVAGRGAEGVGGVCVREEVGCYKARRGGRERFKHRKRISRQRADVQEHNASMKPW